MTMYTMTKRKKERRAAEDSKDRADAHKATRQPALTCAIRHAETVLINVSRDRHDVPHPIIHAYLPLSRLVRHESKVPVAIC